MKSNFWTIRTGDNVIEAFDQVKSTYILILWWSWGEWKGWVFTRFGKREISLGQVARNRGEMELRKFLNG